MKGQTRPRQRMRMADDMERGEIQPGVSSRARPDDYFVLRSGQVRRFVAEVDLPFLSGFAGEVEQLAAQRLPGFSEDPHFERGGAGLVVHLIDGGLLVFLREQVPVAIRVLDDTV